MLYITSAGQFYQGLKMPECGTQWEAVIKRLEKQLKLINAIREPNAPKIDKELQFIKWQSFIIPWGLNSSKKQ